MQIFVKGSVWNRVLHALLFLLYLFLALVLFIVLKVSIEVIDEGLMHDMTIFESEPREGWDYWKWKSIREALPAWIICGSVWLAFMGATLFMLWRSAKNVFARASRVPDRL